MAAMRVARTVTGRDRIVVFGNDYHGQFDEVLVRAGGGATPRALPAAPGIPPEAIANMTVLPYGDPRSLDWIEANGEDIAAVMVEPKPIDPCQAPLLRATLLRLAPDRAVLLLTFHSMIADGWSTGLIIREFHAAAEAIEAGHGPDTREPELQFADYALWEKELLASGALDEALAFWARELRDVGSTKVAPDHPPSDAASGHSGSDRSHIRSVLVSAGLGRAIDAFTRQQSVTLFGLATAALAMMLQRVTGDSEIVIGSQVANREAPEAAELIGPTVNSITLRLPVDDKAPAGAFVRGISHKAITALQHQRLHRATP